VTTLADANVQIGAVGRAVSVTSGGLCSVSAATASGVVLAATAAFLQPLLLENEAVSVMSCAPAARTPLLHVTDKSAPTCGPTSGPVGSSGRCVGTQACVVRGACTVMHHAHTALLTWSGALCAAEVGRE
jgi:hypothetical protein